MRYACVRCFRVSVGTLMKADSTAPAEADSRCVSACLHCLRSSRALHSSYVLKYTRAVGSVPSTAPVSPRYTSRGPCSTAAVDLMLQAYTEQLEPAAAVCMCCDRFGTRSEPPREPTLVFLCWQLQTLWNSDGMR